MKNDLLKLAAFVLLALFANASAHEQVENDALVSFQFSVEGAQYSIHILCSYCILCVLPNLVLPGLEHCFVIPPWRCRW